MPSDPPLILFLASVAVVAGGIAAIAIFLFHGSNRYALEETGHRENFSTRCSGRVGRIAFRGPLVRVAIYDEFIVVAALRPIVLRRADIERVALERERRSGVFGKTVNIHHRSDDVRSPICLYGSSREELLSHLQRFLQSDQHGHSDQHA